MFPRLQLYEQELKGPPIESNASKLTLKCLQDPKSNKTDQKVNMYDLYATGLKLSDLNKMDTGIDPMQKGVSLFLSYTNMNKMNSLHHMEAHPQISNFLQFESHSSKIFKVRAI